MRLPRTLLAVVLSAAVLGGCARGPSAAAWAASVCRALAPWRAEIGTMTNRAQQQMAAATTPAQAKENLVRLFGGAESASETARRQVDLAGVPDVDGGDAVARGFVGSLTAARDAYGRARQAVEKLDTGRSGEFYDRVSQVVARLTEEYERSALDTTSLDSPELKRAFDEVPECH